MDKERDGGFWLFWKGVSMKRLAYIDEDFRKNDGGIAKTIANCLEASFYVQRFDGFDKHNLQEMVDNHKENPYSVIITTLSRREQKDISETWDEFINSYEKSYRILKETAKKLEGAAIILSLNEGCDKIEGIKRRQDFGAAQKIYSKDEFHDHYNTLQICYEIMRCTP